MESHGVENINTQYSGSNFDSFMREQINSGISFLNYRGFYGFSNFNQSDVNQLNNGYKLPFVATLTCGVNNYLSEQESVVEALLRAGSVANPSGAVAVEAGDSISKPVKHPERACRVHVRWRLRLTSQATTKMVTPAKG